MPLWAIHWCLQTNCVRDITLGNQAVSGSDRALDAEGGIVHRAVLSTAAIFTAAHHVTWQELRHLLPIGIVGIISWSVWLTRFTLSRFYRPVPAGFTTTTSVVVPSFR